MSKILPPAAAPSDETSHLESVLSIWRASMKVPKDRSLPFENVSDIVSSIFTPGNYYFFILNFFDIQVEYIHPAVEGILGCKPEEFSFAAIFEKMHPEDAEQIKRKESAALEFFYKRIPPEKIPFYKSSYTFRIKDGFGGWKSILHQSIALQMTEEGRIHHVLSVHTDISFLHPLPDDRISFIGIHGEPSYYALSTHPETILEPAQDLHISDRERDIVQLLAKGWSSKQVADQLAISKNTVDTHRRNLLRRTGMKNTLELAIQLMQKGQL